MMSEINKRYNKKLELFGKDDFRSLNWGDKEGKSAKIRYQQMSNHYDWNNKSVFEIGCGWGSFFDFNYTCKYYHGIDINENFIKIANDEYDYKTYAKFEVKDISDFTYHREFDVAISTGVAGNRGGPAWNPDLLTTYLSKMYNAAQTVLVNFPSNRATIRSEHVEYFAPEYIISQALNITNNVQLIHKNHSDFLLILKHD